MSRAILLVQERSCKLMASFRMPPVAAAFVFGIRSERQLNYAIPLRLRATWAARTSRQSMPPANGSWF